MKKTLLRALPMLFVGLLFALQAMRAQTNYYVNATTGDDGEDGSTLAKAKKTIQAAVNAATDGSFILLAEGTFNERVIINKRLTIDGQDKTKANVTYTGTAITGNGGGIPTIFTVAAQNVTIKNITFTVNLDKLHSAIHSHGNVSGIIITDNSFVAAATGVLVNGKLAYGRRNAVSINVDAYDNFDYANINTGITGVTIQRNVVQGFIGGNVANGGFRSGFSVDRAKDVLIGGNSLADGNTIQTINHDVISRFFVDGDVVVKNNQLNGGGVEVSSTNSSAGTVTIEANTFNGAASNTYTSQARFQGNTNNKAFLLKNNTFSNTRWGVSLENFRNITIEGNTFTPSVTDFRLITVNTKLILGSDAGTVFPIGLDLRSNTFNGFGTLTVGKAISFYNHKENGTNTYLTGDIKIGGVGVHNSFAANIPNYIYIDNNNGSSTGTGVSPNIVAMAGYPEYGGSIAITTTGYWKKDIRVDQNNFFIDDELRAPYNMTVAQRNELGLKITDKNDDPNIGEVKYYFPIRNMSTNEGFATLQEANDATLTLAGHIINLDAGDYTLTDGVKFTKGITVRGNGGATATRPVIKGNGNVTNKALFEIDAPNVKIQNLEFQIAQTGNAMIGITTLPTDNFDNLEISDNIFKGMKAQTAGFVYDSYALKLGRQGGGIPKNQINVVRNTVTYGSMSNPELFGRGFYAYNVSGKIGGTASEGNTLAAVYALQSGQVGGSGSNFEFSNNNVLGGIVALVGADIGVHKISNNRIGSGIALLSQANLLARHLEIRGTRNPATTIEVSGNRIENYTNIGAFIQRSDNVTLSGNTFFPLQNTSNTNFRSIVFSSKEGTAANQAAVESKNLTITGNSFETSGVGGGVGIQFYNHNGDANVKPLTGAKIGGTGAAKNMFHTLLSSFIHLDNAAGSSTSQGAVNGTTFDAMYDVVQNNDPVTGNVTNVLPFNGDIDASYNNFGGVNVDLTTTFSDLVSVKGKITDGVDNAVLGYVSIQPQKAFVNNLTVLSNALVAVPDDFTLIVVNNPTVYGGMGNVTVTKSHQFSIDGNTVSSMLFTNLNLNAPGKEVKFANPTAVAGSFNLNTKVTPAANFILNGANTITVTPSQTNFVNGKLTVQNLNGNLVFPLGKDNSAAYFQLTKTGGTASNFEAEYFASTGSNLTSAEPGLGSVRSVEHWNVVRTSGTLQGRVSLYTSNQSLSGIPSLTPADAVVAWYDGSIWKNMGNQGSGMANGVASIDASLSNTSGFGVFTFGIPSGSVVLPVELLSFTALPTTGGVSVKWSTAKEENNAKFEIEKSIDGKNFFVIENKKGQGNSTAVTSYEFLDINFKQSAYYRLVQVDANGKRTVYSDLTKFVKGLDNSLSVVAYPNPVTTKLYVTVAASAKEDVKLLLTDLTGKALKVKIADSSSPIELDVAGVATGSYILQVIKESGNVSKKIVKL